MDARQAMSYIANRKQWEAKEEALLERIREIHEALSDLMADDGFHGLAVELCELRDKLDGYYPPRRGEGSLDG